MLRSSISTITPLLVICALLCGHWHAPAAYSQKQTDVESLPLKPRAVFPKPKKIIIEDPADAKVLVLKFAEGTHVRVRGGALTALVEQITPAEEQLLKRALIAKDQIQSQLAAVNKLLQQSHTPFERLFRRDEAKLDRERSEGELNTGQELADLNLYYYLFPSGDAATSEQLLTALLGFSIVETAYAQPPAEPAQADIAPVTPNFGMRQGYLNASNVVSPASNGIDARYAHGRGINGRGVRIVDVEGGWNQVHEDLPAPFRCGGDASDDFEAKNHGTAVLGEIVGALNSYGVTGIAPGAEAGFSSIFRHFVFRYTDVAGAINDASSCLRAGDVILIEVHRRGGPRSGETCVDNCGQFEMLPVEYWPADFDAICDATARGVIVVEAAGNGSMDLDAARYETRFNRGVRDSGAIMVGAGLSTTRAAHVWSNHGSRVDAQGWGDSVMTTGYGMSEDATTGMFLPDPAFRLNGDADDRQWYTPNFSGTSSASPIVVGAAALVQSARHDRGWPVLNSFEMRDLLFRTGMPQRTGNLIGPLPNVRAALNASGLGSTRPTEMRLLTIRESDLYMDSGLEIQHGDRVVITGGGEIWSGEYLTGYYEGLPISYPAPSNGPAGWLGARAGASFPLPGAAPYGLIGRFDGREPFAVGRAGERIYIGPPTRLRLRTNDNYPANGTGAFGCLVQIYR